MVFLHYILFINGVWLVVKWWQGIYILSTVQIIFNCSDAFSKLSCQKVFLRKWTIDCRFFAVRCMKIFPEATYFYWNYIEMRFKWTINNHHLEKFAIFVDKMWTLFEMSRWHDTADSNAHEEKRHSRVKGDIFSNLFAMNRCSTCSGNDRRPPC